MRAAVVGGGIAGLTAAYHLADAGTEVTLMEAGPVLGGQIRSRSTGGFLIEEGAEGFPARRTAVTLLCDELGLCDSLLRQRARRSFLWRNQRLEELEPGTAAARLGLAVEPEDLGSGLVTLREGMGQLVDALVRRVAGAAEVRLSCPVNRLRVNRSSWKVGIPGTTVEADAVVLAVPARPMAALLEPELGPLPLLSDLPAGDSITVTVAVPSSAVTLPENASGFIADGEGPFRGCSFCSAKFDHRAPEGWELIRVFFRPDATSRQASDPDWIEQAKAILRASIGLDDREPQAWISRWEEALPRYPAEFSSRAATLTNRVRQLGRIAVCGSAVTSGGIDGAVRTAKAALAVSG